MAPKKAANRETRPERLVSLATRRSDATRVGAVSRVPPRLADSRAASIFVVVLITSSISAGGRCPMSRHVGRCGAGPLHYPGDAYRLPFSEVAWIQSSIL